MRRTIVTGLAVLSLGLSSIAGALGAPTAVSAESIRPDVAELCRLADEEGELEELGITRGECVNLISGLISGPASERANNFIAALCGLDFIQEQVGATNKGQCIKAVRDLI